MKKIFYSLILVISLFILSGCKKDSMDDITIYTTTYPIEYITYELYGENSTVNSIYPNEIIDLSDKLIRDYSEANLFVYNGLSTEKDYAVKMINNNKNLMIVDATMGMEYENGIEELWLNPSNFLMLCLNIRNGMKEYIDNGVLRKQIDENYEKIKLNISELDADIKLLVENADKNQILVSNNSLKFLEKYNVTVLSVQDDENLTETVLNNVNKEISNGNIKYIYMFEGDTLSDEVDKIIKNNNIEKVYFDSLTLLNEENKKNGKDYLKVMNDNLELLKKELYKAA